MYKIIMYISIKCFVDIYEKENPVNCDFYIIFI